MTKTLLVTKILLIFKPCFKYSLVFILPFTCKLDIGFVVPIPILPFEVILNLSILLVFIIIEFDDSNVKLLSLDNLFVINELDEIFLRLPDESLISNVSETDFDNNNPPKLILFPDKYKSFHLFDEVPKS